MSSSKLIFLLFLTSVSAAGLPTVFTPRDVEVAALDDDTQNQTEKESKEKASSPEVDKKESAIDKNNSGKLGDGGVGNVEPPKPVAPERKKGKKRAGRKCSRGKKNKKCRLSSRSSKKHRRRRQKKAANHGRRNHK